mgnify:CR=1 FL=1
MTREEIVIVIEKVLYEKNNAQNSVVKDYGYIAASIAKAVSFNPEFKNITPEIIANAIEENYQEPIFERIMASIRSHYAEALTKVPKPPEVKHKDMPYWGFFFQCKNAWDKNKDLAEIQDLTINFTADWLQKEKKFISKEQIKCCKQEAFENTDLAPAEQMKSFKRAVVEVSMKNIDLFLSGNQAEECRKYIDSKREEYRQYFKDRYSVEGNF